MSSRFRLVTMLLLALTISITNPAPITMKASQDPERPGAMLGNPSAASKARPRTFSAPAINAGGAIVLDFEGIGDLERVNEFYNGGTGGSGSGPGVNFGISFSTNSLALVDADAGGSGNTGGEPSPETVFFFLTGDAATMNVPAGFDTGLSFFYSAVNTPGVVRVFDGLNSTGNLLATLNLPLSPFNGAPDPTGAFSPLIPAGITFNGIARSVDFGGTSNQIVYDDITINSPTPGGRFDICIEDDSNGSLLRFSSTTGEYEYRDCRKGVVLTGTGVVTKRFENDFCKIELQDSGPDPKRADRSVFALANPCTKRGDASVRIFATKHNRLIGDSNITNNSCGCP